MQVKICCFGSSKKNDIVSQSYFDTTNGLLEEVQNSQHSITFVYGGGERGIMGCTRSACKNGNSVISSNVTKFVKAGEARDDFIYEHIIPRQNKLVELSDIFIGLPGGIGTLYEIFQVAYSNHLCHNSVNVAVINTVEAMFDLTPKPTKKPATRPIYVSNQNGLYDNLQMIFGELYDSGHKRLDCYFFEHTSLLCHFMTRRVGHFANSQSLPSTEASYYETSCKDDLIDYTATTPDIKTYYELTKYITFNDIGETNIAIRINNKEHKFDLFIALLNKQISEKFISKKSLQQLNVEIVV